MAKETLTLFRKSVVSGLLCCISVVNCLSTNCCQKLASELHAKVSFPNSTIYENSVSSYWSVQEESIRPNCIVSPTNTDDVSTAVKILTASVIDQDICKFAIRSGGHTAYGGSANIQDGVTIDLSALDKISLSADKSLVTIGPGQRWVNVYSTLEAHGVAVAGGRAGTVGVGGLATGGGLSYFATREGFGCDNVVSYEMVLASGEVINVTSSSFGDLWLALKGGSNNFGIVTEFKFRTFAQGDLWGGNIVNPISTASEQLQAFSSFCSAEDFDENAGLIVTMSFQGSASEFFNSIVYTQPVVNASAFHAFTSIEPQLENTVAIVNLSTLALSDSASSPDQFQQITFATTFENDLNMLVKLFEIWNASTSALSNVKGIEWSLSLVPLNHAVTSKSVTRGGNSLGLPVNPPKGSLILVLLSATWIDASDDSLMGKAADDLLDRIISTSKALGVFNRYIDVNHANQGQDPIAGYGKDVKKKMLMVSERYDPHQVFQIAVPGAFKLR